MSSVPISGPAGGGGSTSAAAPKEAARQPSGEESDRFQQMVEERGEGKGRGSWHSNTAVLLPQNPLCDMTVPHI